MRFVDTNVLLCAVSTVPGEAAKARFGLIPGKLAQEPLDRSS